MVETRYVSSPDEFQIFSVLIGAFCISDIDFYSADTAAHFSCQYSIGDFGKPFFAEIRVAGNDRIRANAMGAEECIQGIEKACLRTVH